MTSGSKEVELRFRTLFDSCHRPVLAYALRRATNPVIAEDVVAETFLVAWRRLDEVPEDAEIALPWMLGVARRVLANVRRGDARRDRLIVRLRQRRPETTQYPVAESIPDATDMQVRVSDALASLREVDAEILRLAVWDQLSHAQIALVLGCSVNAVGIRLHRARKAFAKELAKGPSGTGHLEGTDHSYGKSDYE